MCFAFYGCSKYFIRVIIKVFVQNEHGTFLIRDSESRRNDYSLSVRDGDTVKHYRIRYIIRIEYIVHIVHILYIVHT